MVVFKILRFKNFLSTGNVFTEIKLDRSPNTLVVGTNGAGKSTMLDALTFALFGKPFRPINKPTLVNSINDRECLVEVEFNIHSKKYKIVRGIKPNRFEIYVDGKLLNQDAESKDYQEVLETQILKFNMKAFNQIVILGSSSFIPFMQLSAADRRTIIEDLLDINIFSAMNVVVKEKAAEIKVKAIELKASIDATMAKIDLQKKHIEESQKNNKELIDAKQKEYDENAALIDDYTNKINEARAKVDELIKEVSGEDKLRKKQTTLSNLEGKIEGNISKVEDEIKFYKENNTCPTCEQAIGNAETKINQNEYKLSAYKNGLSELKTEYKKIVDTLTKIRASNKKIQEYNTNISSMNASINEKRKFSDRILKEIDDIKNRKALSEDMMEVSKELVDSLETLNASKKTLLESKKYIDVSAALLKDSGIKAKIVKQYLPVINKLVNKYLASMDFYVNFEIDEEFKEIIKSRHRDVFSYHNFSEGEKMRIDLALLFTWRAIAKMKNSMNTNLLILDEVFDSSMDQTGTDEFMKLIHTLKETNIFVISHKGDILMDKFRSVIKFEKIKNFSRIV